MKIAFYPDSCIPFHALTLAERPLGGTETAIIRLAEALQERGHEVTVFTAFENPPPSACRYLHFKAINSMEPQDVFISVRGWLPLMAQIPCRKRLYWTGDNSDQIQNCWLRGPPSFGAH